MNPPRDKTALITGASAGIGRALARELAAHGHDVVLVARDQERLAILALELAKAHKIAAVPIAVDLGTGAGVDQLLAQLEARGLAIDILVNNAGFAVHAPFTQSPLAAELGMIDLQLGAMLRLTKSLLPGMLARGHGKLLTVASVYSFSPVAFQAVYGACKAFLHSFAMALATETRGRGVGITLVYPGSTKTEFRQRAGVKEKRPGGKGMTAEAVARVAYAGMMRGKQTVVPGILNKLWVFVATAVPPGMAAALLRLINRKRLGDHG